MDADQGRALGGNPSLMRIPSRQHQLAPEGREESRLHAVVDNYSKLHSEDWEKVQALEVKLALLHLDLSLAAIRENALKSLRAEAIRETESLRDQLSAVSRQRDFLAMELDRAVCKIDRMKPSSDRLDPADV